MLGGVATSVNKTDHSAYVVVWLVGETAKKCTELHTVVREKSSAEWRESTQVRDAICNGMVRESFLRM